MNRRHALATACGASLGAMLGGCAGTPPTPGQGDDLAWLNRLGWGATPASVATLARLGRRDFIEAQLQPDPTPALPPAMQARIDAMTLSRTPMPELVATMDRQRREADALADDDARKAARQAWQQEMTRLAREAAHRSLLRAVAAPQQLQERLGWFWVNHFSVHQYKRDVRAMVGDYEQNALRPRALGKFRDLLIASATHPAMLRYLDNDQNAARRLNENYARELMELHTLGIDGGYSQKDVQEMARVLTGLGVVSLKGEDGAAARIVPAGLAPLAMRQGLTEFNPARHDREAKRVLGQTLPAGGGWSEILEQLGRLAREPATARHLCRKLAVYLVADDPPPALVERMSRRFLASDGDIALTLQAMVSSPEFGASLGRKFKDPMQFVVSAVRLAAGEPPGAIGADRPTSPADAPTLDAAPMLAWLNRLGEAPFNRQTPDGYPLDAAAWSGSGQMSTRFEIARAIGRGNPSLWLRGEDATATAEPPRVPLLSNALYREHIAPTLAEPTRAALAAAASPQEWNALLLSSPEFMHC